MSPRFARWLFFLAAFATIPLPYFLNEGETAPALRLLFLSGLMSAVYVTEGPGPLAAIWIIAILQLLFWTLLLYLGATLVTRLLEAFAPWLRGILGVSLVALLLFLSLTEIYWTPLSSTRLRSDLLHLFE